MAFCGYSPRELKVIELHAKGLRPREIAEQIGCSRKVTYNYLWRVTQKTGIKNKAELMLWAIEVGLDQSLEGCARDAPYAPVSTPLGHTV